VNIYVEYWHSIEEVLPLPGQLVGLTPFFLSAGGGGGGGAATFPVAPLQDTGDFNATPGSIYPVDTETPGFGFAALLPPAAGIGGQWVGIYHRFMTGLGAALAVTADGTDTIDGYATTWDVNSGISVIFVSDGISNWIQLVSVFNGPTNYGVFLPFAGVNTSNSQSSIENTRLTSRINHAGAFSGSIHPAALPAGLTDNYSPPVMGSRNRIKQEINAAGSSLGGIDITAFNNISASIAVVDGQILTITNESATATLTVVHESLTSTNTNRFALPGNANLALLPRASKTFIYDAETTLPGFGRWVVFS
jgi:hypothetical protein